MDKNLLNKLPEETEEQYLWRIGHYIGDGLINSWKEVSDIVNSQLCDDEKNGKIVIHLGDRFPQLNVIMIMFLVK